MTLRLPLPRFLFGLAAVLLAAWIASAFAGRSHRPPATAIPTLRFAHWQLEPGVRRALDELSAVYMREHPGVRIEQLAIPERIYPGWVRTQLTGGTAPDLIQLGLGTNDEILANYFEPLTREVEKPNPYDNGMELGGLPWRDTFVDGLNTFSFNQASLQVMSIPLAVFTVRIHYNEQLWREMLGATSPPATFAEFLGICARVRAFSRRTGRSVEPVAAFRDSAPFLLNQVFGSQTRGLGAELDRMAGVKAPAEEVALAYLRGDWSFATPAVRRGLDAMREVSREFQPGYIQLDRADAVFYFLQGRALMIATGSWDSPGLRQEARFPVRVFRLPLPPADGPAASAPSEAGLSALFPFGLTRASAHRELALDFLRFVTSRRGSDLFVRHSGWLSSVVGTQYTGNAAPFMPVMDGPPAGFDLSLFPFGTEAVHVYQQYLYLLNGQAAGASAYAQRVQAPYADAVRMDLQRYVEARTRNIARQDTELAALEQLRLLESGRATDGAELSEGQTAQEADVYWTEAGMAH